MNIIKKLYLWAEKIWFSFPQKIRFILVGGFNSVFAYCVANGLNILFSNLSYSEKVIANMALFIQYSITINVSFWTMRYYVFQSHGVWKREFLKALSVYFFTYCVNASVVTFLMIQFNWPFWLAYGVYIVVFEIIITFLLHKYYSFRPLLKDKK